MMLRKRSPQSTRAKLGQYLLLTFVLAFPLSAVSQTADDTAEMKRAMQLYDQNKFVEVIPILEKLVAVHPSDTVLLERLGWATFVVSGSTKDPQARRQARARALGFLTKAKDLGDNSNLLQTGLEALSQPDTIDSPLSSIRDADAALREGEAAHSRGDLDNAIKGYQRALELDPKMYLAALFTGDMYFKKGYLATDSAEKKRLMAAAGEWFARAISINENIETAYRYWGDALKLVGDKDGARAKFIDGIVAEPFNKTPYTGLMQWADEFQVSMSHPDIQQPKPSITSSSQENRTTILIDPKTMPEGSLAYYWSFYDLARATYKTANFQKDHPGETEYRHSLKEEANALRVVAEIVSRDQQNGKLKTLDPSLENLLKLFKADLIEPYVLFVRVDEGIARDYADYRKANRDKLRRYWNDLVIATATKE